MRITQKYVLMALVFAPLSMMRLCTPPQFARLTLSPSSLIFAPQVLNPGGEPSAAQTITVTSSGNVAASIKSIATSGDYSETNNCPSSLAPKATCMIQVTFSPNAIGVINGAIMIGPTLSSPPVESLLGTGLGPVGVSPSSLDFGTIAIGTTSAAQTVTITNQQSKSLAINSASTSGNYAQTNNCPASLAAGQTCKVNVTFQPTVSGTVPGALTLVTDASLGVPAVGLTGTGFGTATSNVAFSPANFDFGDQEAGTASATQSTTLTNTSTTLSLSISSVNALSAAYVESDTCAGNTLPPGSACTINVSFHPNPNMAPVNYPGAITIVDSDATSPHLVGLSGVGTSPVTAAPDPVSFGTLFSGSVATQTVTITNRHSSSESITTAVTPHVTLDNQCAASLTSGGSCSVGLGFPLGSLPTGPFTGALTITPSSGGFLAPHVVNLSGCLTNVRLSPPSFNFGAVAVTTTSDPQTATLFTGGTQINISDVSITGSNAGDFAIANNTCIPGASSGCTVDVTFTPKASGARSASLNIADDQACSPQQVNLIGGSAAGPFIVTVLAAGSGSGSVASSPAGMNCDLANVNPCSGSFPSGTTVTLTGTPDASSHFTAWGGACSGATCVLDMTADKQITASFDLNPDLTVQLPGNGNGAVSSNPAGIDCPSTACDARFLPGTVVSLTAAPTSGTTFVGWGGACSGTGLCSVTMNSDQNVTATFTEPVLNLTVTGNGNGNVMSSPGGVSCGVACSQSVPFPMGTKVTLTASAASGSTFTGWSGACVGTGSCSVTMNGDQNVTANIITPTFSISASPTPSTITAGQQVTSTVTLTSVNGFNSAVSLTCSVQPAATLPPTCSLNPATTTPAANGSVVSTLTINTIAPTLSGVTPVKPMPISYAMWLPVCGFAWIGIGFSLNSGTRKRLSACLLCAGLVFGGVGLQIACGGGAKTTVPTPGTSPGSYTVTVNGISGPTQVSTSVTFTVQ